MIFISLNTLIQLISAIYITIAFDDILFHRFWAPNIFKTTKTVLNKYHLNNRILKDRFYKNINSRFQLLESISRRRGFLNVVLCLYLLMYNALLSIESFLDTQYPFVVYISVIFITYSIMIFSSYTLKRWKNFIICVGFLLLFAFSCIYFFRQDNFSKPAIEFIEDVTKLVIIITLLLLPIALQLLLSWLYSEGYRQYLFYHVSKENLLYSKARSALQRHDDKLIPEEYKDCFVSTNLNRTEDVQMTKIDDCLCARLEKICCYFSILKIIKSLNLKSIENDETSDIIKLQDEDESVENNCPNDSYSNYVKKYKELSPQPKMVDFCNENNLDIIEFKKFFNSAQSATKHSKKTLKLPYI